MKTVLAIAAGGALGAVARYYVNIGTGVLLGTAFPWGTLFVNLIGCFAMGVLVELMAITWSPSAELRAFLTVGILGALTTFSAFTLDVACCMSAGNVIGRGLYFRFCSSVAGRRVWGMSLIRMVLQWSGVQHRKVEVSDADQRLDRWFLKHFPELPRGRLQKLLRTGQVRVDGKRAKAGLRLNVGQETPNRQLP